MLLLLVVVVLSLISESLWNLEMVCYENLVLSHQYGIFGPETTQTVPFEVSSAVD